MSTCCHCQSTKTSPGEKSKSDLCIQQTLDKHCNMYLFVIVLYCTQSPDLVCYQPINNWFLGGRGVMGCVAGLPKNIELSFNLIKNVHNKKNWQKYCARLQNNCPTPAPYQISNSQSLRRYIVDNAKNVWWCRFEMYMSYVCQVMLLSKMITRNACLS